MTLVSICPTHQRTHQVPISSPDIDNINELLHKQGEILHSVERGKVKSLGVHDVLHADDDLSIHRNVCIINFPNWSRLLQFWGVQIEIQKTDFLKRVRDSECRLMFANIYWSFPSQFPILWKFTHPDILASQWYTLKVLYTFFVGNTKQSMVQLQTRLRLYVCYNITAL